LEKVVNPWSGRKVFLTGHTGFKGGWLALWLASKGAQVRGFSLDPDTVPSFFKAASVGDVLDDLRGDIRDYAQLEGALCDFAPDVVFHLAAQPLVLRSYDDPLGTYSTNVMGTAHVLEAVRKCPSTRAVLCITTDKCYLNREWFWPYREEDHLGGHDPYSSSKACAEIVAAAFRSSFFPPARLQEHHVAVATARAGNVIGGGDWSENRLIPDLMRGFQSQQPVIIRQPQSIRPWQHVLEPLHGYLMHAERLLAADSTCCTAYNFGPDSDVAWTVGQIATKLADIWGNGARWLHDTQPSAHEARVLRVDSSKARAELNWRPVLPMESALQWTAEWYRAYYQGSDMRSKTMEQIKEYESLLCRL
jgi:CDP-glucose 4,6-dehydratase